MRGGTNAQPGGYIHKSLTPASNFSGTIDAYKMGPLAVIRFYHCVPINAGDKAVCTLPWAPVTRFFASILENNRKEYRPLYTTTSTASIYVVAGDSDYYGTLIYITDE